MENKAGLKIGIFIPTFAGGERSHHDCPHYEKIDWPLTVDFAKSMESLGYDSLWICDHLMLGKELAIFEGWTTLAYLASVTQTMKLGPFLICNSYRNPTLLAKMTSTLDVASGGRLYVGIGAGWHEQEYHAYNYQFLPPGERVASLRESIELLKQMWTQEVVTFSGKYCAAKGAVCKPRPVQQPHPPIMVGAWGKKMLQLTADLADAWNLADDPKPEVYKEKLEIIEERCKEIGRDPAQIEKTWSGHILIEQEEGEAKRKLKELASIMGGTQMQLPSGEITDVDPDYMIDLSIHGTPAECKRKISALVDVGVEHLMLFFWDFPSKNGMNLFAETIMPAFKSS